MLRLRHTLKSASVLKNNLRFFGAGHGHAVKAAPGPYDYVSTEPKIDRTQAFMFGEDPRTHKKEGWEYITYFTLITSFLIITWGFWNKGIEPLEVR